MQKNIKLFIIFLLITACGTQQKLISYHNGQKISYITVNQAIKDIQAFFPRISAEKIDQMQADDDLLRNYILLTSLDPILLPLEAQKISNYQQDPQFIENKKQLMNTLPYQLGYQKGQELIKKAINSQKVQSAEISRIFFKKTEDEISNKNNLQQALETINKLSLSSNIIEEFGNMAEEISQEPLGADNGGYLGEIIKGTYPDLDETVFSEKATGLYPEVIEGIHGYYVIYIHSPAKTSSIQDIDTYEFSPARQTLLYDYLNQNIKYLYSLDGDNVIIHNKTNNASDISEKTPIISIWKKKYSLSQIKEILPVLGFVQELDNLEILKLLASPERSGRNATIYQIAIMYKGYNPNIKQTKEYKDILSEQEQTLNLEIAQQILGEKLFNSIDTNITMAELQEFYANTNNRPIKNYDKNDNPIFKTFAESKPELEQTILYNRHYAKLLELRNKLIEDFKISWSDSGIIAYKNKLNKAYNNYQKQLIQN